MSLVDKYLISIEALSDSDSVFYSECKDLYSEPSYRLLNSKTNEEFTLSQDMLNMLMRNWDIELKIRQRQEELRREKYNPIHRFPNLSYPIGLTYNKDLNPTQLYLMLGYLVTGTPTLTWGEEIKDGSRRASEANRIGWRLTFYGYEKANLGFAEWDDIEAIDALTIKLFEKRELQVAFALSNPGEAKEMARIIAEEETE